MFENTLQTSWDEQSRRGLTTLTSFGAQMLALALLMIVPLLRPTAIPLLRHSLTPISLSQPPTDAVASTHSNSNESLRTSATAIVLQQPQHISNHIEAGDDAASPPIQGSGAYIPGIQGSGAQTGVFGAFGMGSAPVIPKAPATVEHAIRLSHMSEGDLIRKVMPVYPSLARAARIQGSVLLLAMISKAGTIENLRLLSGHPMLAPAAIEAVRQWRYRPYILNGEPVEVETQVTVNFSLGN